MSRRESRRRAARAKSRSRIRTALALFGTLALIGGAVVLALPQVRDLFSGPAADYEGPGDGAVVIEIPSWSTGADIAAILVAEDVVASEEAFIDAYRSNPEATSIQAGFYELERQMRASDAVLGLLDPARRAELSITVIPGTTAETIYGNISSVTGIPVDEVRAAAQDGESYGLPDQAGGNPEGWLGTQTYFVAPTATATDILTMMVEETVTTLTDLGIPEEEWQNSLIMASIAQKEALPQDFPRVIRVILNRIDPANPETVGMLGMETVVNYGLQQEGIIPSADQRAIDTPYNVFIHPGLPPTPIAAPSPDAIAATIDPPEGTWNYFVTVNLDTGETKFATTWAEFEVIRNEWWTWWDANQSRFPELSGESAQTGSD